MNSNLINTLASELKSHFHEKRFDSYRSAQIAFDDCWNNAVKKLVESDKSLSTISVLINNLPSMSIIESIILHKPNLFKRIFGAKSYCIIDFERKLEPMFKRHLCNIYNLSEKLNQKSPNEHTDKVLPLDVNQSRNTLKLLTAIQQIYTNLDDNSKTLIKTAVYNSNYEIIEYLGETNEDQFDIVWDDSSQPDTMATPTIIDRKSNDIVLKGTIFRSNKPFNYSI